MKHSTQAAIEILVAVYPQGLELSAIERLMRLAFPEAAQSLNEGGAWWAVLSRAGLTEAEPNTVVSSYRLTDEGFALVAYTRQPA